MKKMKPVVSALLLLCLVVPPMVLGLGPQEDDLVFDAAAEEASSSSQSAVTLEVSTEPTKEQQQRKKWQRVEKLLGMADAVANVGHVFKLQIPKQAFSGSIDYYEARGSNGKGLSHWLRWDEPAATLFGVPSRKDVGRHRVTVEAYGKFGDVVQDSFIVHVVPEKREHFKHKDEKKRCREDQDRTMLTILIDARYDSLKPSAKVNALENLAGFLGLATSSLSIQPELDKESSSNDGSPVVLSGPGNVGRRREKHTTIVQWQVGCDDHFWPQQVDTIKLIPEQAKDGTLSEVMMLPVYQWRVRSDSTDYARNRRDTAGSGDGLLPDEEDDDYDDEDGDYIDEDYDGNVGITESPQEPKQKPVIHPSSGVDGDGIIDEHPHRHHHGQDSIAGIGARPESDRVDEEDVIWRNADINSNILDPKTSTTPSSTTSSSTIAVTLPSTTSTTTITTTTEPPTPSSTTTESTTISSTTTTSTREQQPPSPTTESTTTTTTTTTTTQAPTSGTIETMTSEPTTSTFTNLTQVSGQSRTTNNVTTDSLMVDNEEPLTTEKDAFDVDEDEDDETETDITTTLQSNVFAAASESTITASTGLSTTSTTTIGSVMEVTATAEPNATSIFTVNATADESTDAPVPTREASTSPSTTAFTTAIWSDNSTKRVSGEPLDPYDSMHVPVYNSTPSSTLSTTESTTTTSTTTTPTPPTTTATITTTTTTTPEPTIPSTTPSTTTTTTTTEPTTTTTTTTTQATTSTTTTERIEYGPRNLPPKVERRLKKIPITQGKLLSYTIPEDTFSDPEDGSTKQLRLRVYEKGAPLKPTYWLQFNEETQEVYGLPLEEQYGTYPFEVIAMDSEGLTVSDRLDISVQQHKQTRAINHEFHIYLKIEKRSEFPTNVDWELKVMRSLAELYGDSDLSYITVRSIDIDHDQAIYTWTNDSLVRSSTCPQEDINRLYRVLVSDEKSEEPSDGLIRALGPEIRPKRVVYQGLEQCQQSKETKVNKYPVPRNQIDQLNANVGQLFVYPIPKDTFYDEEDGDTRSMKASLLTANRTEIPSWDWLQFDSSNQEFYGVPLKQDIGRKTYQLVVKDREGLEATDSLVVEVMQAPMLRHVIEISMTLNMAYETFAHSALKKREFIQKLQKLYGDKNTSAIELLSISGNRDTTTVTWRNITLPTYLCPHDEITRLRRVLVNDNKSFTDELNREFNSNSQQPEFAVIQITVSQMGACQDLAIAGPDMPPVDDSTPVGTSHDDYLITFVLPAIIIAAMLILAGIIACILYKRRRSGKMSVSEKDDERQSFRSKGIPVIFQDELDEKPDPGNKSPIIFKEEKPPLPPPEYQRAEDGADIPMLAKENSEEPYQPPPPFATNRDSNRQNRPKPTPTYRKPPPYVPP